MALIYIGSTDLMSAEHTSRFIGPFLRWIDPDISAETIVKVQFAMRKAAHVTEYAILGALFLRAIIRSVAARRTFAHAAAAYLLATLYAATDEFHQSFVSSRGASFIDVVIDSGGALIGVLLFAWWMGTRSQGRDQLEAARRT